jgi:hypothetical protein
LIIVLQTAGKKMGACMNTPAPPASGGMQQQAQQPFIGQQQQEGGSIQQSVVPEYMLPFAIPF